MKTKIDLCFEDSQVQIHVTLDSDLEALKWLRQLNRLEQKLPQGCKVKVRQSEGELGDQFDSLL
jgi:hypothetical protein